MWLTHGWPVKAAYAFVTLTFASAVAFMHPDAKIKTQPIPGPVIYLPQPPRPLPRVIYRRVRGRPVIVPGPIRTVTVTRTVTRTVTVEVPGPTVTVPGPTRTITVVRRLPGPPVTTPPTTAPPAPAPRRHPHPPHPHH